ncbi:hypothetical protein C7S16_2412 [Burkholderia thailandensis]|uniref:Uncharacterized protein n=1 Tax=Burkholderia thailandensis TaxID=57975 RepID=A0AAW9D4L5_BURTH|nr:hypothetical protein [Burkholderia thailandensis]MDW9256915.1 hypothetical protein [Burkholderia thailandensis]
MRRRRARSLARGVRPEECPASCGAFFCPVRACVAERCAMAGEEVASATHAR